MRKKSPKKPTNKKIDVPKTPQRVKRQRSLDPQLVIVKDSIIRAKRFLNEWSLKNIQGVFCLVKGDYKINLVVNFSVQSKASLRRILLSQLIILENITASFGAGQSFVDLLESFGADQDFAFHIVKNFLIYNVPKSVSVKIDEQASVRISRNEIKNLITIFAQADQNPELLKNWKNLELIRSITQAGFSRSMQSTSDDVYDFKSIRISGKDLDVSNCLHLKKIATYLSNRNITTAVKAVDLAELKTDVFPDYQSDLSDYLREDFKRLKKQSNNLVDEIFFKTFDRKRIFLNPLISFTD